MLNFRCIESWSTISPEPEVFSSKIGSGDSYLVTKSEKTIGHGNVPQGCPAGQIAKERAVSLRLICLSCLKRENNKQNIGLVNKARKRHLQGKVSGISFFR